MGQRASFLCCSTKLVFVDMFCIRIKRVDCSLFKSEWPISKRLPEKEKKDFRRPNNIIRHNYIFAMFGFTDLAFNFV